MTTQNPEAITVEKLSSNEVKVTFPADKVTVNEDQIPPEDLLRALTDYLFPAPASLGGGLECIIQVKF